MKLDRNSNSGGRGKYALLKLRKFDEFTEQGAFGKVAKPIADAINVLEKAGILDWGIEGSESEFFVMRLKDKYAGRALYQYAINAYPDNYEYAAEVMALSKRAGTNSPFCKKPD